MTNSNDAPIDYSRSAARCRAIARGDVRVHHWIVCHARSHQASFGVPDTSATPATIARHQWYMADRLVTVELHLRARK